MNDTNTLTITNMVETTNKFWRVHQDTNVSSVAWMAIFPWLIIIVLFAVILFLLPRLQAYMMNVRTVVLDGTLITVLAAFIFSQTFFGSDDAYHYVGGVALFWLKYGFGLGASALLALKGFRYAFSPSGGGGNGNGNGNGHDASQAPLKA